jgi:hypothetical protein
LEWGAERERERERRQRQGVLYSKTLGSFACGFPLLLLLPLQFYIFSALEFPMLDFWTFPFVLRLFPSSFAVFLFLLSWLLGFGWSGKLWV